MKLIWATYMSNVSNVTIGVGVPIENQCVVVVVVETLTCTRHLSKHGTRIYTQKQTIGYLGTNLVQSNKNKNNSKQTKQRLTPTATEIGPFGPYWDISWVNNNGKKHCMCVCVCDVSDNDQPTPIIIIIIII